MSPANFKKALKVQNNLEKLERKADELDRTLELVASFESEVNPEFYKEKRSEYLFEKGRINLDIINQNNNFAKLWTKPEN